MRPVQMLPAAPMQGREDVNNGTVYESDVHSGHLRSGRERGTGKVFGLLSVFGCIEKTGFGSWHELGSYLRYADGYRSYRPIYTYLLAPQGLDYLQTIVFILVIAALVQLVEFILKKYMKPLYRSLGVYLPLITTNCAVLGCTLLNIENHYGFVESLINALGSGLGFMVAMVLFAGVRSKMETVEFPKSFQGIPITLIAASIVSMSFMGFASVADGIFK